MRGQCARVDEDVFGPVVQGCLDNFDFTLLFEETILFVLPASCLILLALAWRIPELIRAEGVVRVSILGLSKSIIYALIFISQVVFLALACTNTMANTRATIPVTAIGIFAIVIMCALSYLEHRRSPRPSSLLTLYLLAAAPTNAARCRTLWHMPSSTGVLTAFIVTTSLMGIALALELAPKDALVREEIRKPSPEEKRGIVERALLAWIVPTFVYGYKHTFTPKTLPPVDSSLTTCALDQTVVNDLDQTLFASLLKLHWRDLLSPALPRACYLGLTLAQPFLVSKSTAWVLDAPDSQQSQTRASLIGAYILVYLGLAVTYTLYRQKTVRTATSMRASLTDYVFQRLSHLDSAMELAGSATTLVSADIERIQFGVRELHEIWANVISGAIVLFLIERAIGVAMVAALGVSLVSMAAVLLVAVSGSEAQKRWFEATEIRVAQVVKILAEFKSIKMMGHTKGLLDSLGAARVSEVQSSQKFRAFVIMVATLSQAAVALVPAFGFATFILLRRHGDAKILDSSRAFGTLTLFSILSSSVGILVEAVFEVVTAIGCISRIQDVCTKHYRLDPRQINGSAKSSQSMVVMNDASAKYEKDGDDIIKKVNIDIKPGSIIQVKGPVASGKSTLLKMILGEVRYCTGEVAVGDNIIGYCDQSPWLDHVSIRDNITGPAPFDPERYADTIRICALDLDLKNIPGGDSTLCFGNGTTLSGGQKARICLARAIYARPRILVLDDCLSGLDANTEHIILENLVGAHGFLREHSITTFLVSASRKPLPTNIAILSFGPDGPRLTKSESEPLDVSVPINSDSVRLMSSLELSKDEAEKEAQPLLEAEGENTERYQRGGERALYAMFIRVAGRWGLIGFIFLLSIFVVGITYPQIYIQTWVLESPQQQHDSIGTVTGIYLGLSFLALFAFSVACIHFTLGVAPRISISFHGSLAKALLYAPLSFLATTDMGSITNRFAQDLAVIDQEIPLAFIGTMLTLLQLLAQSVTLIIGSHFSGIAIPFLLIMVYWIQSMYLPTSYQLRLLDLEAKAPIVSLFVRSIEGLATVRTFGWMDRTQKESRKHIIASQTPFYLLATVQIMLGLVLDLITAALAIIIISISVYTREPRIGLALFSIVGLGASTKLFISQWTELETSLGAMRRIKDFSENTPREIASYRSLRPPRTWPNKGEVQFSDVSLSYSDSLPPVIQNLTLKIEPGWKVGICGRTGSGKSTLVASILGLVHIQKGTIIIDGMDVSLLESDSLRSSVTVVPQNGVLLRASVRKNLALGSPEAPTDERMIEVLTEYSLYNRFKEREGLDTLVIDDLLSSGEQQIFYIVRALLQKTRLVLLDEPTSRADSSTQQVIDSAVLNGFEGSTVLYIAHRLEILAQFDCVIVMDQGRIAEFGDPRELLQNPDSHFASTFNKAHSQISSLNAS